METNEYINPKSYDLYFNIKIDELKLYGKTTIDIEVTKIQEKIILNLKDLHITKLLINGQTYSFKENKSDETITIIGNFVVGLHSIYLEYLHCIGFDMDGLYYVKDDNSIIFSTQLEPIYARKVFPCFDDPKLKSTFKITIESDKNKTFLSNMPEKNTKIVNDNKIVEFETTPLMSTYLVCIVVGDINKGKPQKVNNKLYVNGYHFDKTPNLMNMSIKITAESINYFEKLFGINYKLPKMDIIAIPNFLSGAMENWGLVTFRESGLMTDNVENLSSLINSIEVIYHEISHQWFGNLVTLNSWKDIWLNEATATYFSWLGLRDNYKKFYPSQWYYLTTYRSAMLIDGFESTHPISTEINSSNDVIQFFDEISYSKGSCLINYISEFMERTKFMDGINEYLTTYSWKTAEPKDMYLILDKHSTNNLHSVSNLMKDFILVKGFPIITVTQQNSKYIITKKLFMFNKNQSSKIFELTFPLKIKYFENGNLIEKNIEINDNTILDYEPILNADNMMLCILNYENFNPKIEHMKIDELMHYFDSTFYLSISNYKSLDSIFVLVFEIFNKIDFTIKINKTMCLLHLIIKNLTKLNYILKSAKIQNDFTQKFNDFIKEIKPNFTKLLNYLIENKDKDILTTSIIVDTINFLVELEDDRIIKMCSKSFDKFYLDYETQKFSTFPLHEILFRTVVIHNNSEITKKINNIKNITPDIFIRNSATWALSYSQNIDYLQNLMSEIFNIVKLQDIATFISFLSKNILAQDKVIDWIFTVIKNNLNITYKNFAHIIERITPNIFNIEQLNKLKEFYSKENDSSIYAIEIDKINWQIEIVKNISNYKK